MKRLTERELIDGNIMLTKCELEKCDHNCGECKVEEDALRKLKEYEDLEEKGLFIRFHFGVGDVVYEVEKGADGEYQVISRKCITKPYLCILNEKVGKTVFLTKEEAEKAAKEMEEKKWK